MCVRVDFVILHVFFSYQKSRQYGMSVCGSAASD